MRHNNSPAAAESTPWRYWCSAVVSGVRTCLLALVCSREPQKTATWLLRRCKYYREPSNRSACKRQSGLAISTAHVPQLRYWFRCACTCTLAMRKLPTKWACQIILLTPHCFCPTQSLMLFVVTRYELWNCNRNTESSQYLSHQVNIEVVHNIIIIGNFKSNHALLVWRNINIPVLN